MLCDSFGGFRLSCRYSKFKQALFLQRLFSTFPDGWPGRGLLLLRFAVGVPLFYWVVQDYGASPDATTSVCDVLGAICGVFVIVGLWTPWAAIAISIDEAWAAFSHQLASQDHILVAAIAMSLAMLGPGAWSIDARLFGRKVVEIEDDV